LKFFINHIESDKYYLKKPIPAEFSRGSDNEFVVTWNNCVGYGKTMIAASEAFGEYVISVYELFDNERLKGNKLGKSAEKQYEVLLEYVSKKI